MIPLGRRWNGRFRFRYDPNLPRDYWYEKAGRHERCPHKYRMEGSRYPNWPCPYVRDHEGDCEPVIIMGLIG